MHTRDGERKIRHVILATLIGHLTTFSDSSDPSPRNKLSNRATQQQINMPLFYCYLLEMSLSVLVGWATF